MSILLIEAERREGDFVSFPFEEPKKLASGEPRLAVMDEVVNLVRRACAELDPVQLPRRSPFGSHQRTASDDAELIKHRVSILEMAAKGIEDREVLYGIFVLGAWRFCLGYKDLGWLAEKTGRSYSELRAVCGSARSSLRTRFGFFG